MVFTQEVRESKPKGQLTGSLIITIPKTSVREYKINKGDLVVFDIVKVLK